jgi:DNA-binding winged helix-turn-helix (wHTH) protein/TolB-like protein
MPGDIVRFGDFELNTSSGELRQAGRLVRLQPQPVKVLALLARRAGQIVTREELQSAVWGSDTVVDYENGLNWSVRKIRKILRDDPLHPKFIETVPKRGYRFVAEIAAPPVTPVPPPRKRFMPGLAVAALVIFCCLLIGAGFLQQRRHLARQTTIVVLPFDNLTGKTDRDYLATAATDQVITGIGSRGGLNVIDRATAAKMKRTQECIIRIGEQLRADFVVEGSLVGPPEAPVITAGIYRVRDNTKLWAGQLPTGPDSGVSAYGLIAAKVGEIAE